MRCRGIRGATIAASNTREDILAATEELLNKMVEANKIDVEEVACVIFTTTRGLNAEFPAVAARKLGWLEIPLLCGHEMDVPDSLQNVVRILLLFNTNKKASEIYHIYVRGAEVLRPFINSGPRQ